MKYWELCSLGYQGLDVDFENVAAQDAQAYAQFISRFLREALSRTTSLS